MAGSRLYLLNTTAVSHPAALDSGTLSAALPTGVDHSPTAQTALDLGSAHGSAQVVPPRTSNTGASAVLTSARHNTWVSPVLGGIDITAQTWTVAMAMSESNAAANQFMRCSLYVVKSDGTVRGYVYDSTTALAVEFAAAERTRVASISGSAVSGVLTSDQLVFELWTAGTQTGTTSRSVSSYWNGTVDPAGDVATSDAASYIEAGTQNLFGVNITITVPAAAAAAASASAPLPVTELAPPVSTAAAAVPDLQLRFQYPPVVEIDLDVDTALAFFRVQAIPFDLGGGVNGFWTVSLDGPVAEAPAAAAAPSFGGSASVNVPFATAPASASAPGLSPELAIPAAAASAAGVAPLPTIELAVPAAAAPATGPTPTITLVTAVIPTIVISLFPPAAEAPASAAEFPSPTGQFIAVPAAAAGASAAAPSVSSPRIAAGGLIFLFGDRDAPYVAVAVPAAAAAAASATEPYPELGPVVPAAAQASATGDTPDPLLEIDIPEAAADATATIVAIDTADDATVSVPSAQAPAAAPAPLPTTTLAPPAAEAPASAPSPLPTLTLASPAAAAAAAPASPSVMWTSALTVTTAPAAASAPVGPPRVTLAPTVALAPASAPVPTVTLRMGPTTALAAATATLDHVQLPIFNATISVPVALCAASAPLPAGIAVQLVPPTATAAAVASVPTASGHFLQFNPAIKGTLILTPNPPTAVPLLTPAAH